MERAAHLRVGDVVDGRYELRRDLGRGAGGQVFEAMHRFTQRIVALKVVAPDVPVSLLHELRARLVREARALATARHPGIVEVFDGGILEDGTPYFAMERLEGRTLEGLLAARTRLSAEDTAAVMLQLCEALDAAHRAGVVHRDVKPANILLVRECDGRERVKVVDFGTALVDRPGEDKLSGIGAIIGTPAYMAPEQLLALDDIDCRVDVYALGITMLECLTGRVPYEGAYQRVLLEVCSDEAPPDIRARFPELPDSLAMIAECALAKRREERFPDVVALGRAIHEALPESPTQTSFLGPPPPPRFAATRAVDARQRRRAPRAPYVTPVHLVLSRGSVDGRTEDISTGGMLVLTRQPCEPNQRLTIRFALPIEGHVVSCEADVRWVRAARPGAADGVRAIGLEFVDLPATVQGSIDRYVKAMGGGVSG